MNNKLYTKQEVIDLIKQDHIMVLSGGNEILKDLPKGKWIAGTAQYFMDSVGKVCEDKIFVYDFTDIAQNAKIATFDSTNIHEIATKGYDNGFIVLILPIDTDVYVQFSNHSLEYDNILNNPIVGYIACCKFEDYGNYGIIKTFVATGIDSKLLNDKAVALYVELPNNLSARAEILNLDTIDYNSKKIVFPKTSFEQRDCLIDGKPGNIADYFENYAKQHNGNKGYSQMITSQNGALINRDIKKVDIEKGTVTFFSPAYADDEYYLVKSANNYIELFNKAIDKKKNINIAACFSCISYFYGGNFEGNAININGVYTFGEIGYQLLNKTIVTLEIDKIA